MRSNFISVIFQFTKTSTNKIRFSWILKIDFPEPHGALKCLNICDLNKAIISLSLAFFCLSVRVLIGQTFASNMTFFSHYRMNIQPKCFFFSAVKPKIPDHKTAGHVNSRPIKFQSGCWCSHVVLAISTVRKYSV